jgi:D-sedoheptulose 7-phosphate isomerase
VNEEPGGGEAIVRQHLADHSAVAEAAAALAPPAAEVAERLCRAFEAGGRAWTFGNGGSAADAQHLAGELIGRYLRRRRPLPAMSLATDPSVMTCIANDFGYDEVFARQVEALARREDVVVGFTTSGRSPSVVAGLAAGRRAGATTVLFTGGDGRPAIDEADLALIVPSSTTARVQEVHLLLLHAVSELVDAWAEQTDRESATTTEAVATRGGSTT